MSGKYQRWNRISPPQHYQAPTGGYWGAGRRRPRQQNTTDRPLADGSRRDRGAAHGGHHSPAALGDDRPRTAGYVGGGRARARGRAAGHRDITR